MPRPLSSAARRALFAASTGEALVVLLSVSHPSLVEPIRVGSAGQDVVSRGQTWLAYPFDITLAGEEDDSPAEATLRIDNVDRRIVETVRSVTGRLQVRVEVVLASLPDVIEVGPVDLELTDVEYDASTVSGKLKYDPDPFLESCPPIQMTPSTFPGLFR